MKAGARALGVAESYVGRDDAAGRTHGAGDRRGDDGDDPARETRDGRPESVLAGAVVRADRVSDGLSFGTCTVGGTDATAAVERLVAALDRADVRYLLVAGVAPAWFNILDVHRLHETVDRPVLSVSFEASAGLEDALREHFDGAALASRLDVYRSLPPRRRVVLGSDGVDEGGDGGPTADRAGADATDGDAVFVRSVGVDGAEAAAVVRAFTPTGGRPEPLRVARLAARAAREWRDREGTGDAAP